jgi:pyruvate-formate lyase
MAKFNVGEAQNVEVSEKIPSEKTYSEQLEIMCKYTEVHKKYRNSSKFRREIECLKVLYPIMFRKIEKEDLFAGRVDYLPIGFGCVTSLGGVGHYCVFNKLRKFQDRLTDPNDKLVVDELYKYWLENDLKTKYCSKVVNEDTVGMFIDTRYPLIATARLSGMEMDYYSLLELGIPGLQEKIRTELLTDKDNEFLLTSLEALQLFIDSAHYLSTMAMEQKTKEENEKRRHELDDISESLEYICISKPETFLQALQLFWLYSLLAGVINYGRLDDMLGTYLSEDLQRGRITRSQAKSYIKCLWRMVENRRTTVNGRIIVGGKGRRHPEEADVFMHIALEVAKECKYVEPQFTLRVTNETDDRTWDEALDALGAGATYPTLYNDEVNVPAVSYGMRIDEKTAEQYVPFGCTEFVIQGESTGSPNICMNLLKMLTILLNNGKDPYDGIYKMGNVKAPSVSEYKTFDQLLTKYKELLDYYMDISIDDQMYSYKLMNEEVSFLFMSILTKDCIERRKPILDGGVRYLGGTNEIYGIINVSDGLYAIKKLVFDENKYSLEEIHEALLADFSGYEKLRNDLWKCDKYGNDLEEVDSLANEIYEYVAKGVRDRGIRAGMQYFLVVISNNQLNTEWGRKTAASPDGRYSGMFMNPANNPQGGANKEGPTAMLNSLAKFDPKYHAGSVQNIKFTPKLFNENREMIKALFKGYFKQGGCHIMVTVVGRGVLEDAVKNPENYKDLIVRVSGFSAVFVDLEADIQQEIISRVLYD